MLDQEIRRYIIPILKKEILEDQKTPLQTLEEIKIHTSIVDLAILTRTKGWFGYEIKSDADTLNRLTTQFKNYEKVFNKLTLICGRKHTKKALKMLPDRFGVCEVFKDENGDFTRNDVRLARELIFPDKKVLIRLFWVSEMKEMLVSKKLMPENFGSVQRYDMQEPIENNFEVWELKEWYFKVIPNRDYDWYKNRKKTLGGLK